MNEDYINRLKKEGFTEKKYQPNETRTNEVHDFEYNEYNVILDGVNCILLKSGTGMDHKPLTDENFDNIISKVKKKI